jgi:hypothetical protein
LRGIQKNHKTNITTIQLAFCQLFFLIFAVEESKLEVGFKDLSLIREIKKRKQRVFRRSKKKVEKEIEK